MFSLFVIKMNCEIIFLLLKLQKMLSISVNTSLTADFSPDSSVKWHLMNLYVAGLHSFKFCFFFTERKGPVSVKSTLHWFIVKLEAHVSQVSPVCFINV